MLRALTSGPDPWACVLGGSFSSWNSCPLASGTTHCPGSHCPLCPSSHVARPARLTPPALSLSLPTPEGLSVPASSRLAEEGGCSVLCCSHLPQTLPSQRAAGFRPPLPSSLGALGFTKEQRSRADLARPQRRSCRAPCAPCAPASELVCRPLTRRAVCGSVLRPPCAAPDGSGDFVPLPQE